MSNYFIYSNQFYILSGPSACGKSSLTNQLVAQGLPLEAIVSTDSIRKQILGSFLSTDEYGIKESLYGWELNQPEIFNIIYEILKIRLKQHLPTFLDATNLTDEARQPFVELATKFGIKSNIVIFDVQKEELRTRLSKRKERFDFNIVEQQLDKFSMTSKFPFIVVKPKDTFTILPNLLHTTKIDLVGDVHGLLDDIIIILNKKQWIFNGKEFINPDKNRKVLFLGDAIDRGPKSIELLQTIINTVNNGQGLFILGNHEAKLISSIEQYNNEGILRGKSLSSSQTLLKFLRLPKIEQNIIYQFLINSPVQYSLWVDKTTSNIIDENNIHSYQSSHDNIMKFVFAHANNDYYDPYRFTMSHALYGKKQLDHTYDTDLAYETKYHLGLNNHIYFRGHVPNISQQNYIYSLDDRQAFNGNFMIFDLEQYILALQHNNWKSTHNLFKEYTMTQKSTFNFEDEIADTVQLMKKMNELVKNGLATDGLRKDDTGQKQPHPDGFKIYKYSKKVHFKRLWKTEPLFAKARGLGFDIAGNIIVHPFDKLYNYGEYDTGSDIKLDQKVQMIEKLNGFLGCISKHPFKEELLISTTGSFVSPFIEFVTTYIDDKIKFKLLNYFKEHKQTLMFEVIHPDDQHIIEYDSSNHGLWLIGARGLNLTDEVLTEDELDKIGSQLGFKRPKWKETQFQEVLDQLTDSNLEGYMVRDAETHKPLLKIKTNYYLVTKFIGRLGPKMTNLMYKNPEKFKEEHVEEEFYSIVDEVVKKVSQLEFESMDQKIRTDIVNSQRNKISNNSNTLKI
jgi:predicted kinase